VYVSVINFSVLLCRYKETVYLQSFSVLTKLFAGDISVCYPFITQNILFPYT